MGKLQEKMQRVVSGQVAEGGEGWARASSANVKRPQESLELPTGYDFTRGVDRFGDANLAGSTDPSEFRRGRLSDGYMRQRLSATEDLADDGSDDFYDDVGGFIERANYLDRA